MAGAWGLEVAGALAAGLAGAAGTAGALGADGALGVVAFLTIRIDLPEASAGAAADGAAEAVPFPVFSTVRMRAASSSLMELLWLLAAIDSFSAASSTSLLSRPRSRDSS